MRAVLLLYSLLATRSRAPARTRSLPVLLDTGGAQAGEAMAVNGILPSQEFLDRQGVAAAGFLEGQEPAADCGDDLGLAADDPALGAGRRQVRDRERTSVRPNHVFGPRTMGLAHMYSHTLNGYSNAQYAVALKIWLSGGRKGK